MDNFYLFPRVKLNYYTLLLIFSFPLFGFAQTCQNNILTNPDFEAQHISGWEGAGMYSESGNDRYISVCTNGTNARQTHAAIAGEEYTLTVSTRKSFNDSYGQFRMKFLSSSWQPLHNEYGAVNSTSFQIHEISTIAPAGTAYVEIALLKENGSGCVDADDWCLSTSGGGGEQLPDLNLARLTNLTNAADPGAVVQFNFDLINSGTATASGDYTIGAYLSNDSNFGNAGDVKVGEINTGNTSVGTTSDVLGAITIPNNMSSGSYFLILKADDGEVIAESDEANNFLSGNIFVNDTGGGNGPTVTVSVSNTTATGSFTVSVAFSENVTDFTLAEIQVTNGTKSNAAQQNAANYSFTVTPTSAGDITIVVPADAAFNSNGDGNQVSNTLVVNYSPGTNSELVIDFVDCPQNYPQAGQNITYDIAVTNGGAASAAQTIYLYHGMISPPAKTLYGSANIPALAANEVANVSITFSPTVYLPTADNIGFGEKWIFTGQTYISLNADGSTRDFTDTQLSNLEAGCKKYNTDLQMELVAITPVIDVAAVTFDMIITNNGSEDAYNVTSSIAEGAAPLGFPVPSITYILDEGEVYKQFFDAGSVIPYNFIWYVPFLATGETTTARVTIDNSVLGWPSSGASITRTVGSVHLIDGNESNNSATIVIPHEATGDGVDLELSATSSNNNPPQWSFFSSTFVVTNNGDTEATGVEVQIPTPDGIVLNGGGMFSVSQGHYEPFATAVWTVGTIAAGGNATITLNYFNRTSSAVTIFGQVYAQDQTDVDSSPNNNNGPTPTEDDEAAVQINGGGGGNNDLTVNCPSNIIEDYSACFLAPPVHGPYLPVENAQLPVPTATTTCAQGGVQVELVPNADVHEPTSTFNFYWIAGAGTYTVSWKITDACGSETICSYNVTIVARPVLNTAYTNCPTNIVVEVPVGSTGAIVNFDTPILESNCCNYVTGPAELLQGLASGSEFPIGTTDQVFGRFVICSSGNAICTFTVTVVEGSSGDECGFTTVYTPNGINPLSLANDMTLTESNTGYTVSYSKAQSTNQLTTTKGVYQLTLDGKVISLSQESISPVYDVKIEVDANNNLEMVFLDSPDLAAGTRVAIDVNYINPTAVIGGGKAIKTSTGFAFGIGIVDNNLSPNIINRVIQTDNLGQNVVISNLPEPAFFSGFNRLTEGPNGGLFTWWLGAGNYSLYAVPASGAPWHASIATDTPSSTWIDTKISPDGQFVYTAKTDNQQAFVSKFNASNGTLLEIDLSELKISTEPNGFRQTFMNGIQPTTDGGLLVALYALEVAGPANNDAEVLAKYDATGNLVWKKELLNVDYHLEPIGGTTDGGALFGGNNPSSQTTVFVKLTSTGSLSPDCNPIVEDGIDLELSLSADNSSPGIWSNVTITTTITNTGQDAATDILILVNGCDPNSTSCCSGFNSGFGLVYAHTNTPVTAGTYNYLEQSWSIPSLAAGESATLEISLFTLSLDSKNVYAKLMMATGDDIDSTPGNNFGGDNCSAIEDDEADLVINPSTSAQSRSELAEAYELNQVRDYKIYRSYPTLTENELNILLFSKKESQMVMKIYNLKGQEVKQKRLDITTGSNLIKIDVSELSSGMHHVMLLPENGKPLTTRFIKQRL